MIFTVSLHTPSSRITGDIETLSVTKWLQCKREIQYNSQCTLEATLVLTVSRRKLNESFSSVGSSSMSSVSVSPVWDLALLQLSMRITYSRITGQTGLGKSTLINTIFASHLIDSKGRLTPDEPVRSTTEIQTASHIIEENGVRLRLNIVDTPGYGDQVNNDRCWDPIVKYIKDQHSAYLRKELTAQRERYIQDTRIHCCLFFIQPSGHALKPIDIVVLKKLSDVVNVVPVIAKSDSLTLEERSAFKERIKEEFSFHNLKMYPYDNDELDEEERALNAQIKVSPLLGYFYVLT